MTDNQTIKDRLISFISYLGIGQGKFEKKCGLANAYVANIRKSITPEKLQKIAQCYPELNTGWLMTGDGYMLKPTIYQSNENGDNIQGNSVTVNKTEKDYIEIIKRQSEQISKSQEQIDKLLSIVAKLSDK